LRSSINREKARSSPRLKAATSSLSLVCIHAHHFQAELVQSVEDRLETGPVASAEHRLPGPPLEVQLAESRA
jgi:hypothetical protein